MCANYEPVTASDRLLSFFGVVREQGELPFEFNKEVWPTGLSPFIRRREGTDGGRQLDAGHFGLVPHFMRELAFGRRTYNARSETVHKLASFKTAWSRGQRCIVPVECVFEPCYLDLQANEMTKPVRYRIKQPGGVPFGVAGIWYEHHSMKGKDGKPLLSFAMLTVNADGHPVFKRMHKPGDEKRMVVIVDPAEYDRWLQCSLEEASTFFQQWQGPLDAFPDPLPERGSRKKAADADPPPDD